jgi:1,4-alpha-glucan branching enzyme
MSLQKKYLKSKPVCKVKFELPKEHVSGAKHVCVVGEFNGWNESANKMKKQKDGSYTATLDLETGSEYQFRYVMDGERWENDPQADRYTPNDFCGADNSVVVV